MSEGIRLSGESLPLSVEKRLDEACDRFEAAWKAGRHPAIETFLSDVEEPERGALLGALVALEVELRGKIGERPAPVDYEKRFPDHGSLIRAAFALTPSRDDSQRPGVPSTLTDTDSKPGPLAESPPILPARYKVCKELGGGAFGKVYLADDSVMEIQVAIKVPSSRLLASQRAREQFLSEARTAAKLRHESIVRVYDVGEADSGLCYIVYEYIDGTDLEKRIKPERIQTEPLTADAAGRLVAQLAGALHCAHLEGLVHRDIKPANVLLDCQGTPYLTDFGLAVREEDLSNERGRLAGTLPYMSPEQVRRESHHIDGRSDIYSLGVILYELLCGRRPFEAKTWDELEDQILHREAKPPRMMNDAIPPEMEQVCLKALSKRITDRYPTAKDMADELRRASRSSVGEEPIPTEEILERMGAADTDELQRLLRLLRQSWHPACVPSVFRCLGHVSEGVRQQARKVVHAFGWDKVSDAAEELARRENHEGIAAVLDGLAAFEPHPQVVALLDRLLVLLKGDPRNRAILLLERKRLGLELDAVAALFRDIHSPYRLQKALGQGLVTAAYLAHADGTDLKVVVRMLRPELVAQAHLRTQFLDVHKKALQLVHENLVLTREARAFPERNMYFAVRDFVDGVSMQKLQEDGRRFEPAQVFGLLRQLLAALGAVHRRSLSHGAVKPSNIFVDAENRVVLGDLSLPVQGIGLALERLSYDYRYTAPEMFQGKGELSPASDFYSLGCVAYELVCGEPPFVSDNYVELAARHVHESIVPPSRRGSPLGPWGDEVLLKLLARSPAERYSRAEEILTQLNGLESRCLLAGPKPSSRDRRLLRDASFSRLRSADSILGFDASAASLIRPPGANPVVPTAAEPPPESEELLDTSVSAEDLQASGISAAAGAPAREQAEHPHRIGPYDIIEPLGQGGMGVVYKARDPRLDRLVALKVLPAGAMDLVQRWLTREAPVQSARFQREARAVARLQHPHIVQIYDIGEHEGLPFLALEYVAGKSLAERLRSGALPPRVAAETLVKIAGAVQYAHKRGVLHRDLKPSNILLTSDEEPKIADFGLARLEELPSDDIANLTSHGTVLGTPSYMSPEQAAGDQKQIGPAADIYSLGAILYESLTGRPPFRGKNMLGTLTQIATQAVVPAQTVNPDVPVDLSAICLRCLEKDPQKRYPSAQALADDLAHWLADKPIQARVGTPLRATGTPEMSPMVASSLPASAPDTRPAPWWKRLGAAVFGKR
jgi:serine/threonine protein kinase